MFEIACQIVSLEKREKKDKSGSYSVLSGVLESGGVFEQYCSPDIASKLEGKAFPSKAKLIFEPSTYQAKVNFRLVDVKDVK